MNEDDIDWHDILPEPFVALELGARGEGKTALGHRLLEVFGDNGRDAYIMGFPDSKAELLPEYIEPLHPGTTMETWPENSIVLIHEAHHLLHARRSMDQENLEIDFLVTVSRHKDSDIIYDTQQSQRLDKNAVAAVDAILVRWPALMQEDFERRQVRPIISDARDTLSKYVDVHEGDDYTYVDRREDDDGTDLLKKHAFVHADQFRGEYPGEIGLADHWSEEISKAYGGEPDTPSRGSKTLEDIREDMVEPEDVGQRSVEDIEDAIEAATGEPPEEAGGGTEAADQTAEAPDVDAGDVDAGEAPRGDAEDIASARSWIEGLIEQDNRVFSNQYGQPIIEFIAPADMTAEVSALIEEYDLNPQGARVMWQEPSFAEQRPDISEGLVGWQFVLDDPDDRDTVGYDLDAIESELEDEPVIATRANIVGVSVFGE